jgi:hypothetical protein
VHAASHVAWHWSLHEFAAIETQCMAHWASHESWQSVSHVVRSIAPAQSESQ